MKKTLFDDTGLKEYKRKRNFGQTSEPRARVPVGPAKKVAKKLMFVIQKHDATRLHYDFRLEMEGVLKSWAVPKGPPTVRGDKRLAVQVEDHPFDYAKFEGTIPEGNYGAGTVMVWDIGTYSVSGDDPLKGLREGKLHIHLEGKKLKGEWALVRMKPRPGEDKATWLMFKAGEDAKPLSAKKEDESVLTGRSMKQIESQNTAQWKSSRPAETTSKVDPRIAAAVVKRQARESSKGALKISQRNRGTSSPPLRGREGADQQPGSVASPAAIGAVDLEKLPNGKLQFVEPMKCRLVAHAPKGPDWIYEIKFDGFRTLALKDGKTVELLSRNKKSLNQRFPEIVAAVRALPCGKAILDGEVVALDQQGRSSFQLLQMADMPGETRAPLCCYLFDLLNFEGKDLRRLSLRKRKALLQSLITEEHEPIRFSADIHGDPQKLLAQVEKMRLEGIIAKEVNSEYEAGRRSGCWQKIKVANEQEFVIGGYTAPKGSRDYFGSVTVGYYEGDKLIFVSKVGTGFDQALLTSLYKRFQKLKQTVCPFANLPEKRGFRGQGLTAGQMRKCTWVEPELVCEIRFTEWTRDNHLRQPVFLGLREDKNPREVVKEEPK
ncbi:MAG: polymerase LigD, ligase domain protein [Verrucomicrobiales bacterium]|nr:polymerase LigD, ligase domain protein [Verrucomicrobiales bacterium]